MRRSIWVLVGVGVSLRWESIHLLVDLGTIDIDLGEFLLAAWLISILLEEHGLTCKCLLKLSWLRIEAIVVIPLILEVQLFSEAESESTD